MRCMLQERCGQTHRTGKSLSQRSGRRNGTAGVRDGYRTGGKKDFTGETDLQSPGFLQAGGRRLHREGSTCGLILLTNDGDLINAMMRGANRHEKEYIVKIDREITPDFLEIMRKGIYLKDLDITTRECKIEKTGKYTFQIILTQGVNRQIRRMCEACGAKVRSLKRIRVMNIRLGDLKPGEWREVTGEELETLLTDTGMLNRK